MNLPAIIFTPEECIRYEMYYFLNLGNSNITMDSIKELKLLIGQANLRYDIEVIKSISLYLVNDRIFPFVNEAKLGYNNLSIVSENIYANNLHIGKEYKIILCRDDYISELVQHKNSIISFKTCILHNLVIGIKHVPIDMLDKILKDINLINKLIIDNKFEIQDTTKICQLLSNSHIQKIIIDKELIVLNNMIEIIHCILSYHNDTIVLRKNILPYVNKPSKCDF